MRKSTTAADASATTTETTTSRKGRPLPHVTPETIGDFVKTLEAAAPITAGHVSAAARAGRRRQLTIPGVDAAQVEADVARIRAASAPKAPKGKAPRPAARKGGHRVEGVAKVPEKAPINGNDGRKGRVFSIRLTDDNRASIEWLRAHLANAGRREASTLALGPFLVWCVAELGHEAVKGFTGRLVTGRQALRAAKRGGK